MKKIIRIMLLLILMQPAVFAEEADHLAEGKAHFENGFYQLTPKHLQAKAAREYALAIREFNKAIVADPENVSAYRYLARVYSVQKNHAKAAEAYLKVITLDPKDINTYVLAALELIESQQLDKAIRTLQSAKELTDDKAVLQKLDSYIVKTEDFRNSKEVSDVK